MTGTLLNPKSIHDASVRSPNEVFYCPEESHFYSQCLEKMVLSRCTPADQVIEFGSGDGSPVIHSLLRTQFSSQIQGYELNPTSYQIAQSRIQQYRLDDQYIVHNQCFFEGWQQSSANYLISNPPYLPAPDSDICMPALHGGHDGAVLTRKLFDLGCEQILSLISAYSNPLETIEYALAQGYSVTDFMISPLKFGYYSSEPKVKQAIAALRRDCKAFYSQNIYLLAGVLFQQRHRDGTDLSSELLQILTAF